MPSSMGHFSPGTNNEGWKVREHGGLKWCYCSVQISQLWAVRCIRPTARMDAMRWIQNWYTILWWWWYDDMTRDYFVFLFICKVLTVSCTPRRGNIIQVRSKFIKSFQTFHGNYLTGSHKRVPCSRFSFFFIIFGFFRICSNLSTVDEGGRDNNLFL